RLFSKATRGLRLPREPFGKLDARVEIRAPAFVAKRPFRYYRARIFPLTIVSSRAEVLEGKPEGDDEVMTGRTTSIVHVGLEALARCLGLRDGRDDDLDADFVGSRHLDTKDSTQNEITTFDGTRTIGVCMGCKKARLLEDSNATDVPRRNPRAPSRKAIEARHGRVD